MRGTQSSSTTKRELLQPDTNDNAATSVSEIDLLQDGDFGIRGGYRISNPLPWFVIFQGRTLCSGSLIHGDIILTAAHCVDDNGIPPSVRVGSTDYFSGGTVVGVSGGEIYPEWTMGKPSDPDLAIVVLDQFLNNDIAILNFDSELPEPNHNTLFTMGHGLINDSQSSRTLQGADIPYIDDCSDVSRSYERFRHICTDSRNVATCGGDSGMFCVLLIQCCILRCALLLQKKTY